MSGLKFFIGSRYAIIKKKKYTLTRLVFFKFNAFVRPINFQSNDLSTIRPRCGSNQQFWNDTELSRKLVSASNFQWWFLKYWPFNSCQQKTKHCSTKPWKKKKKRTKVLFLPPSSVGPEYSREIIVVWVLKRTFFLNLRF